MFDKIIYKEKDTYYFHYLCPGCAKASKFITTHARKLKKHPNIYFFAAECLCGELLVAYAEKIKNTFKITDIISKYPKIYVSEHIPDEIKPFYIDLAKTYRDKDFTSFPLIARTVLEKIFKYILNLNNEAFTNKSLASIIGILAEKHIVPKKLEEAAHLIRLLGNNSAHEVNSRPIEEHERFAIWEIINILIQYIFVLPARIEKLKNN